MPRKKKRFGQHHLRHPGLCRPVVDYLRPAGRPVVEIGPGSGVLTRALLDAGARVLAVEIDAEWAFALRCRPVFADLPLAVADAMDLRGGAVPAGTLLAGNLPFQIATPLIERVLGWRERVPRAAFLVQLEVARRLVAVPGSPDYGALSVLTAAAAEIRWLGVVGRRKFRPPPRVDAAFVGLELRPLPVATAEADRFRALVRLAFGRRRKTVRNALTAAWERSAVDGLLERAGLDPLTRAGELSLTRFVELHRAARELDLEVPAPAGLPRR